MDLKSPRIKIAAIGILVLLLLLFNRSLPADRTQQQREFDNWLAAREKELNAAMLLPASGDGAAEKTSQTRSGMPMLNMQMVLPKTGDSRNFSIPATAHPEQISKILRLLQLMRESDIFSVGERSKSSSRSALLTINVRDGSQLFSTTFQEIDVQKNLKALLLLKLFKEFADQVPSNVPSNA